MSAARHKPEWRVATAGLGDAEALRTLERAAFGANAWADAAIAEGLVAPSVTTLLLFDGPTDEPCGFALWRLLGDEAEILTIGVHPARRREGGAKALLAGVVKGAGRAGAVRLFLEVSDRNAPALALYVDSGFAPIGRRARYYADGADAIVMRLALGGLADGGCGADPQHD